MKRIILSALCISTFAFANVTTNIESSEMATQVIAETSVSTSDKAEANYEFRNDGIPWNREFDSDRMVRHQTFDPALKVAYSYSLNFVAGSFGSFANQSFMGHFAYEFTPNLHLYANISNGSRIAREDLRQGNVNVLIPDVSLEYKPSENTLIRISYVNERDALKAYGPRSFFHSECPSRSSILCQ